MSDLSIQLSVDGALEEEVAEAAEQLMAEISESLALEVTMQNAEPSNPEFRAKGSPVDYGQLVIQGLFSAATISGVVSIVSSWLSRDNGRSLKIKTPQGLIEAKGLSEDELRDVVRLAKRIS